MLVLLEKGRLRSHGVHQSQLILKKIDFIFLEFFGHCFLFVSYEPKLSKPYFPFNTFLLYRCLFPLSLEFLTPSK